MLQIDKLQALIPYYKEDFLKNWQEKEESFKWKAVQTFQKNWNPDAENFSEMFLSAVKDCGNLLGSFRYYPTGMIKALSEVAPERVRKMFINLYDESGDVGDRIDAFIGEAESIRSEYNDGGWDNHYQNPNSVSTYLWLRYPDKYSIFKYSEVKEFAKYLDDSVILTKRGNFKEKSHYFFDFYSSIAAELKKDSELRSLLDSVITPDYYSDPEMHTMAIDFCHWYNAYYPINHATWEGEEIQTGITKEKWSELLADPNIFNSTALRIVASFLDSGGESTCKALSEKYGYPTDSYNLGSTLLAKRILGEVQPDEYTSDAYWPVLYIGRRASSSEVGDFVWKLRQELREALEERGISDVDLYSHGENIEQNLTPTTKESDDYDEKEFLEAVFCEKEEAILLKKILSDKKNLILCGAPGVGKTFIAKRLAYYMMGKKDESRIEFVQFHQNYTYEDFVIGYRPNENGGFDRRTGVFYDFCQLAASDPDRDYFFIIDEINRGNLSKIFGELLMAIESDKRDKKVTLGLDGCSFSVPRKLHIIGMMNTADRSLALIDYALRRRFYFYTVTPAFGKNSFVEKIKSYNNETLNRLISTINDLNKAIEDDESLGVGYQIGHSYFCDFDKCKTIQDYNDKMSFIVNYDLIPTLAEYWCDNPAKLKEWTTKLKKSIDESTTDE